jgi:sporadic carbohydrate cluster 2OG-Fe(II) oxygenase
VFQNNKIFDLGGGVFNASDNAKLNTLREAVYNEINNIFELGERNPDVGLNNFHIILKNISDVDLNKKKVEVIKKISNDHKLVDLIYDSFSTHINSLLGNDLLVQKTINLVIQTPNDQNPTIPHRDAPPNSYFEIVIWIPLVDCALTKSMYMIDLSNTEKGLKLLEKEPDNWEKFLKYFDDKKIYVDVKFGQALFFLPYIYHGSDVNKTEETRFSLNIRFKGLFSPSGRKFPLHFFRLYKMSKLTKLALEKTKEEILK